MEEKRYNPLKILFAVLLFGGLWGIVEATLGTFLHLPFVKAAGMFTSSTTILVPIAMFIMGACYKRTGSFRSVLYMGLLAGAMKALVCAIFRLDMTPVLYIMLESVCAAGALAAIRPKDVISFKGLGTLILAVTSYLVFGAFIRFRATGATGEQIMSYFEKYVLMYNALAILYSFAVGATIYGIMQLANRFEWKIDGIKKVIYSPITASVVVTAMVVVTFLLR